MTQKATAAQPMLTPRTNITVCDLPLADGVEALRPEQVVLRFGSAGTLDVGALCYLSRATYADTGKGRKGNGRPVAIASYCASRAAQVKALIEYIGQSWATGRPATVFRRVYHFLRFMDWADERGLHDGMKDPSTAGADLHSYVAYLRDRVLAGALNLNTACAMQNAAIMLLGELHGVDTLSHGANLLVPSRKATNNTTPPDEDGQGRVLAMCGLLFTEITSFLLENKPYPHCLKMPGYLPWADEGLWVFPTTHWADTAHHQPDSGAARPDGLAYDYARGRLRTKEEIKALVPGYTRSYTLLTCARKQLENANSDPQNKWRRQLGMLAMNCFIYQFVAETAMNWTQVAEQKWDDEYSVVTDRQGFHSYKARAGHLVFFEASKRFRPKFEQFLKLRAYLLAGTRSEHLFFSLGSQHTEEPKPLDRAVLTRLFEVLRRIDPSIPKIGARQLRAAKSDRLLRTADTAVAAVVLQSSEQTVKDSYAAGSVGAWHAEMGHFLTELSAVVIDKGQEVREGLPCALGTCSSPNHPHAVSKEAPIQPDCRLRFCWLPGARTAPEASCASRSRLSSTSLPV